MIHPETESARWTSYGSVILLLTTVAQSSVSVVSQGMAPIAPFVQETFLLSRAELALLNIAIACGTYFTLILSGRLLDRLGERIMLLACGLITGFFAGAMLSATSFPMLLGLIALMSVGTALATPAGSKAVMGWFPPLQRATAMSIRQVGIPVGGMLAGILLPQLALAFGWRAALAVGGGLAISGSLLCFLFYRNPPVVDRGDTEWRRAPSLRDIVRRRDLWWISVYGFAMIGAQFTFSLYIVVFAHERLGFSAVASGALLALAQGVAVAARIAWGRVSDRGFGGDRIKPLGIVAAIAVVGSVGLSFLEPGAPNWLVLLGAGVLGASALGWQGVYVTTVSELAGHEAAGTALGFSLTIAQLGQLVAPPLFGYLADQTGAYQPSWLMLGGFVLLVAALPIYQLSKGEREPSA